MFGGQVNIGVIESITVTIAVHEEEFPFPSPTVNVTLLFPISAHVKLVLEANKLTLTFPQLLLEPPLISFAVMETFPVTSK